MTKSASSLIISFSIYLIICIVEFALAIEWNKVKPMYLVSMYPTPPSMRQDNNSMENEPVVLNLEKETMPNEMITKEAMNRIFGGNEANEYGFTYQVGFLLQRPRGLYWCGGSLISNSFVLTAAHCVDMASRALVFLGAHDIKNPNEPGQIRMMVFNRDFIIYPSWNPRRLKDDIALVRLPRAVVYNERIQPIQLPKRDYEYRSFEDKLGIASGWGRYATGVHAISNILRYVQLRIVNGQTCKNSFPLSYRSTNICTSGRYQKSTCNGDSGGPLVLQRRTSKRRVLIGITSFGSIFGCDRGYPAAFTKVASYLDWIWDQTGINPNVDLSKKYNFNKVTKANIRSKKKKKYANTANKNAVKTENIGVIDTRLRKYPDAEPF
ncbi:brachyurin [Cochliomyia hominivorax]